MGTSAVDDKLDEVLKKLDALSECHRALQSPSGVTTGLPRELVVSNAGGYIQAPGSGASDTPALEVSCKCGQVVMCVRCPNCEPMEACVEESDAQTDL